MPFRRSIGFVLLALLNGCAAAASRTDGPAPPPAAPVQPAPAQLKDAGRRRPMKFPPTEWQRYSFRQYDQAAAALRLAPLRSVRLPAGEEEVRAWIGGSLGWPRQLYRVRRGGGRVHGQLFQYWLMDDDPTEFAETRYEATIRRRARGECGPLMQAGGYEGCAALFTAEPDWAGILEKAEAAGLWRLPDEGSMAARRLVLDGWTLVVELRSGDKYRAYKYASPSTYYTGESAAALKVATAFSDAVRHMRRSKAEGVYRGQAVTGGRLIEFRPCASDAVWGLQGDLRGWTLGSRAGSARTGLEREFVTVVGELTPEWLARRWHSPFARVLQVRRVVRVAEWAPDACDGVRPPHIP